MVSNELWNREKGAKISEADILFGLILVLHGNRLCLRLGCSCTHAENIFPCYFKTFPPFTPIKVKTHCRRMGKYKTRAEEIADDLWFCNHLVTSYQFSPNSFLILFCFIFFWGGAHLAVHQMGCWVWNLDPLWVRQVPTGRTFSLLFLFRIEERSDSL